MKASHAVPSVHDLYRAPRGRIANLIWLNIWRIMEVTAYVDAQDDMGNIGESQALEVLDISRKTVNETITLN